MQYGAWLFSVEGILHGLNCYIVATVNRFAFVFIALFSSLAFAQAENSPDSTKDAAVDSSAAFRIDEIRYSIGDVFDDSKVHTKYDKWAYDLLNWIHIETREHTVKKLLLFDEGDLVNFDYLLESERFLRDQKFLSDASIDVNNENGKNIATVKTSDNWTLTIPLSLGFSGSEWTYDNMNYGIGLQESNFLGLGQKLGFFYGHNEFRNMWQVEYGDPHFLFRYNHLDFLYSYNTDGYLASWNMQVPFLSRSVNQWAYTLSGLKKKEARYYYGSGDMPLGTVRYSGKKSLESLPLYNGNETVKLLQIDDFINDSLSFRLSRSFGGSLRKLYVGFTYDYNKESGENGELSRYLFMDDGCAYVIDSTVAWNEWIPERKDSRLGLYLKFSKLRYEKIKNLHNVKWTEDVDKGYVINAQISKNYEQLGSSDNDIRLDFTSTLYLGQNLHHLTMNSEMRFYLDGGKRRDFYGRLNGEYIFHLNNSFSTALVGVADFYEDAKKGYQLTLGGSNGFVGFPTGYYAGQARVYGNLEQRWFPDVEIATLMPVVVVVGSVGETAWQFGDINREDLIYVAGFGLRLAQKKSISRLINKLDVSFPLNGARKGEAHYSVTTGFSL